MPRPRGVRPGPTCAPSGRYVVAATLMEDPDDVPVWTAAELATYESALRAAAAALCRQPFELDDLIQDTFERALRYLRDGRPRPERMVGWLVTIMRNAYIDRIRQRKPALELVDDRFALEEEGPPPAWSDLPLDEVRAAIAELDEGFARAIDLHYVQGLRYREVAERLGIPENTVASRMHRARKALHALLVRRLPR